MNEAAPLHLALVSDQDGNSSAVYREILQALTYVFFSSRRRHTIFKCDWSSDVCSSDLHGGGAGEADPGPSRIQADEDLPERPAPRHHPLAEERRSGLRHARGTDPEQAPGSERVAAILDRKSVV